MRRVGSAIVSVLFLLVIGVVIASSVLVAADGAATVSRSGQERVQTRSLAWSGVQAVMAELAEQRDALLDGEDPDVTPEWALFTLDDGTRGVVRLVDLDPESDLLIVSESAKLDVNAASEEMLAGVPGLNAVLAERIVGLRDSAPLSSLGPLMGIEGMTPVMLYGEPAGAEAMWGDEPGFAPEFLAGADAAFGTSGQPGGLGRYLTTTSFDPNVQIGWDDSEDSRGNLRVNLDQDWSDALGEAITERFDEDTAAFVEALFRNGMTFGDDAEFVGRLVDLGVDPAEWGLACDVFTTTDDEFLLGRVDVNRASREVLACLPGVTPEIAQAIVDRRETVDPAVRRLPTWLVTEQLIEPDVYAELAGWVTARSMQWRVRLEVGLERGDPLGGGGVGGASAPMSMEELTASFEEPLQGPRLEHRMVVEAVIDVGSSRARVASMREVTMLEPMVALLQAEADADRSGFVSAASMRLAEREALDAAGFVVPEEPEVEDPEEDPFGFDGPLDFGSSESGFGGDEAAAESGEFEADAASGESVEPGGAVDRRIGRWTTRRAGRS